MEHIKTNERGRRIGESHPRAVLTDHEIELLMSMLDERESYIAKWAEAGLNRTEITIVLRAKGLTLQALARTFEVSKGHVWKVANGMRRCQEPVG